MQPSGKLFTQRIFVILFINTVYPELHMTVEIKYVVVRQGEEKMSFASKKEADAWDKMLDLAEAMGEWLTRSPVMLEPEQVDGLAMWLAQEKDALNALLKTGKLPKEAAAPLAADSPAAASDETPPCARGAKKTRAAA
jgi:dsDNA-binding SOS-regulon protein